jgi:hypothetical protein
VSEGDDRSYDHSQKASLNIESTIVDPFGPSSSSRFYTDTFEERDTVSNLLTLPNRDTQEGQFKDGKLEGDGVVIIKAGDTLKGLFEKGIFVSGVLTLPDGETREGTFKDGKLEGDGVIITKAGNTLKGLFEKGVIVRGIVTLPNG